MLFRRSNGDGELTAPCLGKISKRFSQGVGLRVSDFWTFFLGLRSDSARNVEEVLLRWKSNLLFNFYCLTTQEAKKGIARFLLVLHRGRSGLGTFGACLISDT